METKFIDVITHPCPRCGATSTLRVPKINFDKWQAGAFIQDAFRDYSPDFRELLMSGYHDECFELDTSDQPPF